MQPLTWRNGRGRIVVVPEPEEGAELHSTHVILAAAHLDHDPTDHLPREIGLIEAFLRRHPKLPQVACFDTAFHRDHAARRQATADPAAL